MPRKPQKLPDYFTAEESEALVRGSQLPGPHGHADHARDRTKGRGVPVSPSGGPAAASRPSDHQPEAVGAKGAIRPWTWAIVHPKRQIVTVQIRGRGTRF